MSAAEPLRNQHLDAVANQLVACIPRELLEMGVHKLDPAALVDNHHAIRHGLEDVAERPVLLHWEIASEPHDSVGPSWSGPKATGCE